MFARVGAPVQAQETPEAPFHVLHLQQDRALSGSFRPDARLVLTSALRTTGFWAHMDPADAHTLILLLSFLSPNGHATPAVSLVAEALHCSPMQARSRLLSLTQKEWQGQALAVLLPRDDGNDAFAPGPFLLAQEHPAPPQEKGDPLPSRARREDLLAHSRARYARPRAEVEASIAERMGWGPPTFADDPPGIAAEKQDLFQKMTAQGMSKEQTLDVLARFPVAEVQRQVEWLPLRNAKSPSRFLLAAIEGDYDPPLAIRREASQPSSAAEPLPNLPGLAEDVFNMDERAAAMDRGHVPLHDPESPVNPPDSPGVSESTLYRAE